MSFLRRILRHFTAGDRVIAGLALALIAYYCATRGIFQGKASGDGLFGFFYLPGLFYHHTLDMGPPAGAWWVRIIGHESTGHVANPCPIGPVPLWAPTYLLGLGLKKIAGIFTTFPREALPGQTIFDYWMAGLGSLIAGLSGVATMFRLIQRYLGTAAARFGTVGAVAATSLAWYFTNQPLYQHACAFWAVTLFIERWDAWRTEAGDEPMPLKRWLALGALGGVAMLMRIQEAIWLLLPGLDAAAGTLRSAALWTGDNRRRLVAYLLGGVGLALAAALVFAPQLVLWKWYFGTIRTPQPQGHMRWGDPALLGTLFSMRGGLISWSPILYLFIPGLLLARRRMSDLWWRLGLLFLVELWVNASAWDHWAAWTYGARRFTDATVVFGLGLAGFWHWCAARRRGARALRITLISALAFCIGFNLLMMELVRQLKVKSSGSGAFPASTWVKWAKGPDWLARAFDKVGYPFVQPIGWIYAAVYRAPINTFEGIVGNYLLERDWRVHEVIHFPGFAFSDPAAAPYVPEGLTPPPDRAKGWPKDALVPASGGRVRILVPLGAHEPIRIKLTGDFGGRENDIKVSWNDAPLEAKYAKGEVRVEVPEAQVRTRARTNVLLYTALPPGAKLRRLDFESFTRWWEPPPKKK